ncbi:hypothetical protein, partial [Phormidesmis priestleyi]
IDLKLMSHNRGDRGGITTPMHPTAERLSVGRSRLSAAGDWERCAAKISVETVVWALSICVQDIDDQGVSNSEIRESISVVQGCSSSC